MAVAGAASAQVNLSGYIAYGYKTSEASKTSATTGAEVAGVDKSSGWGMDDTIVTLSTTEDLGGGMKLSASYGFANLSKGNAVSGDGATVAVEGSFGKLTMSSVEGSDYLPIDGLTSVANGSIGDRVTFALPAMNGLALSYGYKDGGDNVAAGTDYSNVEGYGFGASKKTLSSQSVTAAYTTGPLSLTATYLWTPKGASNDSVTYAKVAYDFGVAKVTAGMVKADVAASTADVTETGLTVAMPVGPLAVTASIANREKVGSADRQGYGLGASYALSKRTALAFYTESYDHAVAGNPSITESKLELQHSF